MHERFAVFKVAWNIVSGLPFCDIDVLKLKKPVPLSRNMETGEILGMSGWESRAAGSTPENIAPSNSQNKAIVKVVAQPTGEVVAGVFVDNPVGGRQGYIMEDRGVHAVTPPFPLFILTGRAAGGKREGQLFVFGAVRYVAPGK